MKMQISRFRAAIAAAFVATTSFLAAEVEPSQTTSVNYDMSSFDGWNIQTTGVWNLSLQPVSPKPYEYTFADIGGDRGIRMKAMFGQAYLPRPSLSAQRVRPRAEVDRVLFRYTGLPQLRSFGMGVLAIDYVIPKRLWVPSSLRADPAVAFYDNNPNIIGQIMMWNTPTKNFNNYVPIAFILYRSDGIYLEHLWNWNTNRWPAPLAGISAQCVSGPARSTTAAASKSNFARG